jgi:hypothetical protein
MTEEELRDRLTKARAKAVDLYDEAVRGRLAKATLSEQARKTYVEGRSEGAIEIIDFVLAELS